MKKIVLIFFVSLLLLNNSPVFSGEVKTRLDNVDIFLGGQLRPRYEFNDKSTTAGSDANNFFSQRSRFNVGVESGPIMGFVQFQDVRIWGEETDTLNDFSANGFDIHQAYLDLVQFANMPLTLRIGRQEIILEGHRLMGNVDWTQRARSHDGVKLISNLGPAAINLFATKERERNASGTPPGSGDTETDATKDRNVFGAWAKMNINDISAVSTTLIYQYDDSTGVNMKRATWGMRGTLETGGIKGRLEGSYQFGDFSSTQDAEAYMIGARLGYTFDTNIKPNITLWYDYLSGDSNTTDNKNKAFDTLYATNHKFYGFMDLFLNIPVNTSNKGLQDMAVKASAKPYQNVSMSAHVHHFLLAQDSTLDGKKELGQEVDLTIKWKYHEQLTITGGYSHFFNTKLERANSGFGNEDADWAYLMMDFAI